MNPKDCMKKKNRPSRKKLFYEIFDFNKKCKNENEDNKRTSASVGVKCINQRTVRF